jgi:hypothetical protein
MRQENEQRLKELEQIYMRKKENSSVGRIMREKMGYTEKKSTQNTPRKDYDEDDEAEDVDDKLTKSQKKKKSVRIADEKENLYGKSNKADREETTATFTKQDSRGRANLPASTKSFDYSRS